MLNFKVLFSWGGLFDKDMYMLCSKVVIFMQFPVMYEVLIDKIIE